MAMDLMDSNYDRLEKAEIEFDMALDDLIIINQEDA